jgi:hypothetical protein
MRSTSVKEIISRIVRNTRLNDSSYLDDMLEWIPEGIDHLQTRFQLSSKSETLNVVEHVSQKLPCGLVYIDAIELVEIDGDAKEGRLPEGSEIRFPVDTTGQENDIWKSIPIVNVIEFTEDTTLDDGTVITAGIYKEYTNNNQKLYIPKDGSDLTIDYDSGTGNHYYHKMMDYVQTSFPTGKIKIHYLERPVDKDGYPLVPDVEEYKTALYWYIRMMLIGAGWQDPIFSYEKCNEEWEKFASRAIGKITYPSVDRMERVRNATTRLIPPATYWKDFHAGFEQPEHIAR